MFPATTTFMEVWIMRVGEAIESRRAVKSFDPSHVMGDDEIDTLLEAARWSPTAINLQHVRFAVVTDPALRRGIRAVGWNQPQLTDASALIAVCADLKAWDKSPERYLAGLPEETVGYYVGMIRGLYGENEALQRDEGFRSGGMAAQTVMLKAREMGYDTCPMTGYDPAAVSALLALPTDHALIMIIAVGKKAEEPNPRWERLPLEEIVVRDRFA
jgi:nitroreductase